MGIQLDSDSADASTDSRRSVYAIVSDGTNLAIAPPMQPPSPMVPPPASPPSPPVPVEHLAIISNMIMQHDNTLTAADCASFPRGIPGRGLTEAECAAIVPTDGLTYAHTSITQHKNIGAFYIYGGTVNDHSPAGCQLRTFNGQIIFNTDSTSTAACEAFPAARSVEGCVCAIPEPDGSCRPTRPACRTLCSTPSPRRRQNEPVDLPGQTLTDARGRYICAHVACATQP